MTTRLSEAIEQLLQHVPEDEAAEMFEALAGRLTQLAGTGDGAHLELHVHVHQGRYRHTRFDPDILLGAGGRRLTPAPSRRTFRSTSPE